MADVSPVKIRGYGWPLLFIAMPGLWNTYRRLLIIDIATDGEARIHKADHRRQHPVGDPMWVGRSDELQFRKLPLVIGVSAPGASFRFWVDVPEDKRALAQLGYVDG